MFVKRAFNKIGELVTGSDDQKKQEEEQKKDSKQKPEQNQEMTFDDLLAGKNEKTLTNRETARTAVPVKRDLQTDGRYERPTTTTKPAPPTTSSQPKKSDPSVKGKAIPDFFNDLLDVRDEELKEDDAEPPFFLAVGDQSEHRSSIRPQRANQSYQDDFFNMDNNQRKVGTVIGEPQKRSEDMRQGFQLEKDQLKTLGATEKKNLDVNESPGKFTSPSEKLNPVTTQKFQQTQNSQSLVQNTKVEHNFEPSQRTNASQLHVDVTLPNNRQQASVVIMGATINTVQTPQLNQSSSNTASASTESQKLQQTRQNEGISPALLRIQERKRATLLLNKQRPEIDDLSLEITETPKRKPSILLGADAVPMNSQKKEASSSFSSDNPPSSSQTSNYQVVSDPAKAANQQSPEDENFIDYSSQRVETARIDTQRRQALKKNTSALGNITRLQQQKQEELDRNSSESYLTDKSFDDNCSVTSDDIERSLKQHEEESLQAQAQEQEQALQSSLKLSQESSIEIRNDSNADIMEQQDEDFFKLVNENESTFKTYAEKKLAQSKNLSFQTTNSLSKYKESAALQKVVTNPVLLKNIGAQFGQNVSETCIALSQDHILVGTSAGVLFIYNRDAQTLIGTHKEDGKDFVDNAITSIDVHPNRQKYAVVGFKKGQISLLDLSKLKDNLKLIKDVHKKPVVSVKFCNWIKERPHLSMGSDHKCNDCADPKDWMFVSVDTDGKVVLHTVVNIKFGLLYANDYTLNDPTKNPDQVIIQTLAPRFYSARYPLEGKNDMITLVAMASFEGVVIKMLGEKTQADVLNIDKPKRYPSENMSDVVPITSQLPCLAWGYGKTPRYNFQTFPILAIAWGPLIQLVVFKDIEGERDRNEDFHLDGHYIIAQGNFTNSHNGLTMDNFIESLQFIDDSLLYAVTATQEIRVMNTEKFKEDAFIEPEHLQIVDMSKVDSRCKIMPVGTELTKKQTEIEMERIGMLEFPLLASLHGQHSSQTQAVFEDKVVCLTEGGAYSLHHLGWLESLGSLETTSLSRSWIEIFAKALEIYLGKVKGLRIAGVDEDMRRGSMRDQLKNLIEKQVINIISQWKTKVEKVLKSGLQTSEQFEEEMNNNFTTLIKIVIEFCIEISEPGFLFEVLLKKFVVEGRSNQFAEEIKPYIICREFSDCVIPENVMEKYILQYHRNSFQLQYEKALQFDQTSMYPNPAENFEKILINLRLDQCSNELKLSLIEFCKTHKLSSGLVYACQNGFNEQGPLHALYQLRDLFLDTFTEEAQSDTQFIKDDLIDLRIMSPTDVERVPLENSSVYLGMKLLWIARLYLIGKKFPLGHLTNHEWHIAVHDIVNFLTQDEIISQFSDIDAAAYFQILTIVFNNPSSQYTFIQQGRPEQTSKYQPVPKNTKLSDDVLDEEEVEQMILLEQPPNLTHEMIVQRITDHFEENSKTDSARLHYLCFIASIAGTYEQHEPTEKDVNLYFEVALELLKHSEDLVSFNKDLLTRRMTNKQMYRRLSIAGNHAPDDLKHIVLSEQMLLVLLERSKPHLHENRRLEQLLKAAERTNFENVKLVLYEANQDYLQCLKLFMRNQADKSRPKLTALAQNGIRDGFGWVEDKHKKLEQRVKDLKDKASEVQLQNFENEVLSQAIFLVKFNIAKTIQLCDAIFKSAHLDVLEKLHGDQAVQLSYIKQLVESKKEEIKEQISSFGSSGIAKKPIKRSAGSESQKWNTIFCMHVRLLCALQPTKVANEIEQIIRDNFYPMEDCLKICIEFKQTEASALLYKKIGNYQEAINIYLKILESELSIPRFKKEVFYLDKDQKQQIEKERAKLFAENQARLKQRLGNQKEIMQMVASAIKINVRVNNKDKRAEHYRVWVEKFGKNIGVLDKMLDKIQNICKFHPEVLENNDQTWQTILLTLFKVLFHPSLRKKGYCKRHLKLKMVSFCRCILPYVSFSRIVAASVQNTKTLRFKAIKELVHDIFQDKSQEFDMCLNAQTTQQRDLVYLQEQDNHMKSQGVSFLVGALTCGLCQRIVHVQALKSQPQEEIKIFDCSLVAMENHAFHARCLRQVIQEEIANDKTKKGPTKEAEVAKLFRCPICYPKNQDHLCGEPIAKQVRSKESENGRSGGNEDSESDSETSKSSTKSSKSETTASVKRVARPQLSLAEQKQIQREKHMKLFEDSLMNEERLSLDDFTSLR